MSETLFQQIGGNETIDRLIPDFYEAVIADPVLAPFFQASDVDRIISMQKEFFAIALQRSGNESQFDLYQIHANRGIQREHLSRFTSHLLDVLERLGITHRQAIEVVDRIAMHSNDILGEAGGIDG